MKIKRRTIVFLYKLSITLLCGGGLVVCAYSYFFTPLFTITSYDIVGVDDHSSATIETLLRKEAAHRRFYIFSHDKIGSYSSNAIFEQVRTVVSDAKVVRSSAVGLHRLQVVITRYTPLFRVSGSEAIDEQGNIFSTDWPIASLPRLEVASSSLKLVYRDGYSITQMMYKGEPISQELLGSLSKLSSQVSEVVFPVETISIEASGDIIFFNAAKRSKILFTHDINTKKAWSTLLSAIDTDPLKGKLALEKEKLEYLDVRFGNKVFYRFSDMAFQKGETNGILGGHASSTNTASVATTTAR